MPYICNLGAQGQRHLGASVGERQGEWVNHSRGEGEEQKKSSHMFA